MVNQIKFSGLQNNIAFPCILGLSVLELCLLITMKYLVETFDDGAFNFQMVFSGTLSHLFVCLHFLCTDFLCTIIVFERQTANSLRQKYDIFCIFRISEVRQDKRTLVAMF